MWKLIITNSPAVECSAFDRANRILGDHSGEDLRAAIWWSGLGPWSVLFPFTDDKVTLMAAGTDGKVAPAANSKLEITSLQFSMAWLVSNVANSSAGPASMAGFSASFCLILRPKAAILLKGEDIGFYVPSPDASAHEIIADIEALEREFPGLFRIED